MRGQELDRGKPLIGPDVRRLDDEFLDAMLFGKRAQRPVNIVRPTMQDIGLALFDAIIAVTGLAGELFRLFAAAEIEGPAIAQEYAVDALAFDLSCRMGGIARGKSREGKDRRASAALGR